MATSFARCLGANNGPLYFTVVVAVGVREDGAHCLLIQTSVVEDEVCVDLVGHLEVAFLVHLLSEKVFRNKVVGHRLVVASSSVPKIISHG